MTAVLHLRTVFGIQHVAEILVFRTYRRVALLPVPGLGQFKAMYPARAGRGSPAAT
jgi:hypothetical protein